MKSKSALLFVGILALLSLSGCKIGALADLGYSDQEIAIIEKLDAKDVKIIESYPYDKELTELISDPTFAVGKLEEYLKLEGLSAQDRLMIVNNGYYCESYDEAKLAFMKTPYYIHSRLNRYLDYKAQTQSTDLRAIVEMVNCNRDHDYYTDTKMADTTLGELMIANKYYSIGEYEPDDLVSIESEYGLDAYMEREAYQAYKEMADAMFEEGIDVWITSAYRPYSSQVRIYNSYLENDPQEVVDTYSARPGFSDHQTGRVVDLISEGGDLGSFEGTKAQRWLSENAHEYGFILRYPEDKVDMTGYMYESWHYRYVGKDVAFYIKTSGITFDEYYAYFIEG